MASWRVESDVSLSNVTKELEEEADVKYLNGHESTSTVIRGSRLLGTARGL